MFRLLLLAVLLPVFGCAARPTRVAADVPPDVPRLNVLTYNVNFALAGVAADVPPDVPRLNVLTYNVNFALAGDGPTLAAVAQGDADVVFLQETTPEWQSVLRANLARQFPYMVFKHWPGAGGLGVLSKLPIESVQYLAPVSWFPAARIVLKTPLGRVQVLNVHLRPPIGDPAAGRASGTTSPFARPSAPR